MRPKNEAARRARPGQTKTTTFARQYRPRVVAMQLWQYRPNIHRPWELYRWALL